MSFFAGGEPKLVALEFEGRRAGRQGMKLYDENENEVGEITSGSFSPSLKKVIVLALVEYKFSDRVEFFIKLGKLIVVAKVTGLPFYKEGSLLK